MKKLKFFGFLLLAIITFVFSPLWSFSYAQSEDALYFPDTGHSIRGKFLQHFEGTPNALLIYGYPITDEFVGKEGILVQYFQRARFEESPEGEVVNTPLGRRVYALIGVGESKLLSQNPCREFPETGKRVCYAFLDYFDANGGVERFGYPISEFEIGDTRFVQYFEYARFEWHTERLPQQPLVLTELGRVYFNLLGENPLHLEAKPGSGFIANPVLELQVRAFIARVPFVEGYRSLLYVIVLDQNSKPVQGASVSFVIRYPDGREDRLIMNNSTNRFGYSALEFPVSTHQPGMAEIIINASFGELEKDARTSFRIWY